MMIYTLLVVACLAGSLNAVPEDDNTNTAFGNDNELWVAPAGVDTGIWLKNGGLSETTMERLMKLMVKCDCLLIFNNEQRMCTPEDTARVTPMMYGFRMTVEQAQDCIEIQKSRQSGRHKRKISDFYNNPEKKWPMPITYKYFGRQGKHDYEMIEHALRIYEKETCVRFNRAHKSENITQQHILFTSENTCWSYQGRINSSILFPQPINLQVDACTSWVGLILHEIGHALGFWHEHLREDRNDYIRINNENIYNWTRPKFAIPDSIYIDDMGVQYDMGSVMHYGPKDFSKGGRLVAITPLDPLYNNTIGQRVGLSFHDAQLINLAYCADSCPTKLDCKNGGYTNTNDCNKCTCPEGLGGTLCDTVEPAVGGCYPQSSAVINLNYDGEFCLESGNYHDGLPYNSGDRCNWLIKAPEGCQIKMKFVGDFGVYCWYANDVCMHWVEIKYKKDLSSRGPRFCCKDTPKLNGTDYLISESNTVSISFNAEFPRIKSKLNDYIKSSKRRGFKLCYKIADMSCVLSDQLDVPPTYTRPPVLEPEPIVPDVPCHPYPTCVCTQWGPFSQWTKCSRQCSGCGTMAAMRKCVYPFEMVQTVSVPCNVSPCEMYSMVQKRTYAMELHHDFAKCCNYFNGNYTALHTPEKCNLVI